MSETRSSQRLAAAGKDLGPAGLTGAFLENGAGRQPGAPLRQSSGHPLEDYMGATSRSVNVPGKSARVGRGWPAAGMAAANFAVTK